ncbi:unnamed protein product [Lactuca virosa]|uniref:Uncharacterized protein n=1 Tax=Lactuca virosa TaxID=75947 RepID=A0AAU9M909_9ASTR|nr:unnamed protein product [Lactuca virosa]
MKFEKLIEFSTTKFTESDELKDMKKVFEQEFNYKSQNEDEKNVMNEDDGKSDDNEDEEKRDENLIEHEIPEDGERDVNKGDIYKDVDVETTPTKKIKNQPIMKVLENK